MYEFNNEVPIYLQIVDLITKEIISGKLKPGQKILSVREYAFVFKANPNTISKALQILEENKLIFTERTNGKYVTDNLDVINKYKEEIFNNKLITPAIKRKKRGSFVSPTARNMDALKLYTMLKTIEEK